jgi:hypothetical protein
MKNGRFNLSETANSIKRKLASFLPPYQLSADEIDEGETHNFMTDNERTNLADAFLKSTDDSDDLTEGAAKLLMTTTERTNLADAFLKSTDDSDDLTEGAAKLLMTTTERTNLADAFLKSTDDSDDLTEGAAKLLMTTTERTNLADAFLKSTDDSDDLTEGAAKLLMTTDERSKLAVLSMPYQRTIFHCNSIVVTGGKSLIRTVGDASFFNHWTVIETNGDGDEFKNYVSLAAGTYSFIVDGITSSSSAKIDWYLDAVAVGSPTTKIVSAQDWYSGTIVYNVRVITAGINVAIAGNYFITGKINGRNGSNTTGYYFNGVCFHLVRTGAPA